MIQKPDTSRQILVGWMKFKNDEDYEEFRYYAEDDDHEVLKQEGFEPVYCLLPYEGIKYMDINEFRDLGFLQEVNRLLLHECGLALEVTEEANGFRFLSGVWDYRDDPEGMMFEIKPEEVKEFQTKAEHVHKEIMKHSEARKAMGLRGKGQPHQLIAPTTEKKND